MMMVLIISASIIINIDSSNQLEYSSSIVSNPSFEEYSEAANIETRRSNINIFARNVIS